MLLTELVRGSNPRVFISSCVPGRSLGMGVVAGPEGGRAGGPGRPRTAAPGPGGNPGGTGLELPGTDHNPVAVQDSPAVRGTAAVGGSPAVEEDLAGRPPAAGHTGRFHDLFHRGTVGWLLGLALADKTRTTGEKEPTL